MAKIRVVGVVGCTGTGKTTLCEALSTGEDTEVVSGDDFFLPAERCPPLNLSHLWPDGDIPEAFSQKKADTNVPESMDWSAFESAVLKAIASGEKEGLKLVLVESFLLCSSATLLKLMDNVIFLDHNTCSPSVLLQRKWERAHLGKKSYKDCGVSLEDYSKYWEGYVLQRYEEHCCLQRLPPEAVVLDCAQPLEVLVTRARATLSPNF